MSRLPLHPGDVILTWHEPGAGWRELLNRYFHRELVKAGEKRYPWAEESDLRFDHVRVCVESDVDRCWGFEFTAPAARHFAITEEMLRWPGLRVYRARYPFPYPGASLMDASLKFDGTLYDLGALLAFKWPWLRQLDFGARQHYCSTGARSLLSHVIGHDVLPCVPIGRTLPCDFAIDPDFFRVNLNKAL